ncbi:MAG: OmpA family protein [Gemmatimonadetes bacterium]|nr:OmpA family protein [Gemmatimonadota bacterium]
MLAIASAPPATAGTPAVALLGELLRPDKSVTGDSPSPETAWAVQLDFPFSEHWTLVTDGGMGSQLSSRGFGAVEKVELDSGFRYYPRGAAGYSGLFVQATAGWMRLKLEGRPRAVDRPFASVGVGQRIALDHRWAVQWEARAEGTGVDRDDPVRERIVEPSARLGLSWSFGSAPDADGDGVADHRDACPATREGAIVDASGCPRDTDRDGVPDGLDICTGTPVGVPVDESGCSALRDSDGDGVPDGVDACPGTERGTRVDARGCETDEPLARAIPQLPLQDIVFRYKSVELTDDAIAALDRLAATLQEWPEVTIDLAGSADGARRAPEDEVLALRRAQSVRAYLIAQGVPAAQLRARGRGDDEKPAPGPRVEVRAISP